MSDPQDTTFATDRAAENLFRTLGAQFQFERTIARGGMGVVYLARNLTIIQPVAVKMLSGSLDERRIERFKREASALSKLEHYNIVRVIDFGFTDRAQPYMVLEYIDGLTLPNHLDKYQPNFEKLRQIFLQIVDALSFAHSKGILHRDLKPSNIMVKVVDSAAIAKIIDFGIAKLLTDENAGALTQTGELLGSPTYMSPEQVSGIQLDGRSDIYSFGCVLFEALTGQPPFTAATPIDLIFQHLNAEVPAFASITEKRIPASLETITRKCLEKDPAMRYRDTEQLRSAFSEADLALARSPNALQKGRSKMIYLAAILMTLVAGNLIFLIQQRMHNTEQKEVAQHKASVERELHNLDLSTKVFDDPDEFTRKFIRSHRNEYSMRIHDSCNDAALAEFTKGEFATRHVDLENSEIKGPGLAYLIRLPLYKLELQRSSLTDRGMIEISKMKTLTHLVIDATKVTSTGLSYLSAMHLDKLSARDIKMTDEGLIYLCKISTLRHLMLDGNTRLTGAGYKHLADLPNLEIVSFQDQATTPELIDALLNCKKLNTIFIVNSDINDEQLKKLGTSKTLKFFHLQSNRNLTTAGLRQLCTNPRLVTINIKGAKINDNDLHFIESCKHPVGLSVQATPITDEGCRILLNGKAKIHDLDVSGTQVSDTGLMALAQIKSLGILRIDAGDRITESGVNRFVKARPDVKLEREYATNLFNKVLKPPTAYSP